MGFTQIALGWVVSFIVPYIINPDAGDLGGKIGYVFFGLGFMSTVLLFFFCPETRGLNYNEVQLGSKLIQIDYLFTSGTNSRKFQGTIKKNRQDKGGEFAAQVGDKSLIVEKVEEKQGETA